MSATLYINATVYPAGPTGDSTFGLTCVAYLASDFIYPPNSKVVPPASSAGTCTASPTGNITGLDNTKNYYLLVYNPQGYMHWFLVDWSSGNSAGSPMNVEVPVVEQGALGFVGPYTITAIPT
jgi:hypothetical protein